MKKKVLVLVRYYIPGFKAGGPIQSIKNMVDNLSNEIDFYILTSDRDSGDKQPYKGIETDKWIKMEKAYVYYTNINNINTTKMKEILASKDYDVLYLNSFFSYKFSILPVILKKFKKLPNKPLVVAPRGEFSEGALGIKGTKKKIYLSIIKLLGLYRNVTWHVTAENERKDIERVFGKEQKIKVANNLTEDYSRLDYTKEINKKVGELNLVFLSRISPKKNLKKAIKLLRNIQGDVKFTIYGALSDKEYWNECQQEIAKLPQNIVVNYEGVINHSNVLEMFKKSHIFFFPTLGENFGHVISEALIGGCPVIISDQTPWNNLEKQNVGWDIGLSNEDKFIEVLQHCVDMGDEDYQTMSRNAFEYGKKLSNKKEEVMRTYNLFN